MFNLSAEMALEVRVRSRFFGQELENVMHVGVESVVGVPTSQHVLDRYQSLWEDLLLLMPDQLEVYRIEVGRLVAISRDVGDRPPNFYVRYAGYDTRLYSATTFIGALTTECAPPFVAASIIAEATSILPFRKIGGTRIGGLPLSAIMTTAGGGPSYLDVTFRTALNAWVSDLYGLSVPIGTGGNTGAISAAIFSRKAFTEQPIAVAPLAWDYLNFIDLSWVAEELGSQTSRKARRYGA